MWLCYFSVQSNPFAIKFLFFCGSVKNPSLKAVDLSSHTWSAFCPPSSFHVITQKSTNSSRTLGAMNAWVHQARLCMTFCCSVRGFSSLSWKKTSRNEFRGWGGRSGNCRHVDSPTKMPDTEYRALSADAALCQRMWRVLMRSQR
jgi:hypothetical protein